MSEHNITVEGGSSVRLPTAGKYCDRDILITASSSGNSGTTAEDLTAELTEQDELLTEIEAALGLKTISATLTVNFANEEEPYDYENDVELDRGNLETVSWIGSYTINGGERVFFEDMESLEIPCSVGSVVEVISGDYHEYGGGIADVIGCEVTTFQDDDYYDAESDEYLTCYRITVTNPDASFTAYDYYA